jgi:glycosyltransferase involved in cell wall biosynthesis
VSAELSTCTASTIQGLVLGLGSRSGRTQLVIIGGTIDPAPFRPSFHQVTCILTPDYTDDISSHEISGLANENTIVLWLASAEDLPTCSTSRTIADFYHRDAIVIRISVPSEDLNNPFLRGRFLSAFQQQIDVKPIFLSLLMPMNSSVVPRAVAIYDRPVQSAIRQVLDDDASEIAKQSTPPLAIMSCYNEEDIIEEVALDYRQQGCELVILDNWSTDTTWDIVERLHELDPVGIEVHRFPSEAPSKASWWAILARKEEIALQQPGRWILHADADELRRSPFEGLTIAQALRAAQISGSNRIDFNVLNFRPVHGGDWSGSLERAFRYFEFPDHSSYFSQKKAWIQPPMRVNLTNTGGHEANFDGQRDFRYRFLTKHFSIRSESQGRNKLHRHREARWDKYEKEKMGWHVHYQSMMSRYSSLIWPVEELHEFSPKSFHEEYGLIVASELAYYLSPLSGDRSVRPQHWSDPNQGTQLTKLLEETRDLNDALQVERNLLRDLKQSLSDLKHQTNNALQVERNSLRYLKQQSADELDRVGKLINAERERGINMYRQQVAQQRRGICARLLDRFRSERRILSNSGLVDAEWYLQHYPDVTQSPLDHYIRTGASEGRDPNPSFSTTTYLKLNPDVAMSGMNPLVHFLKYGAAEGRSFSE